MFSCYPDMVYITSLEAWGLGDFTRHGNIDKSLSDKSLSLSLSPSFPFALDTNVYMHLHHCYYYGSWSVIRCTAYTPRPLYTITPSPQYNNKIIYIYIYCPLLSFLLACLKGCGLHIPFLLRPTSWLDFGKLWDQNARMDRGIILMFYKSELTFWAEISSPLCTWWEPLWAVQATIIE